MRITATFTGMEAVQASLTDHGKQVAYATTVALTKTAKAVQAATYVAFSDQFDRPTPLTMKSMFITPATKDKQEAAVFLKDTAFIGKNRYSMAQMIGHQFTGGPRQRKAMEDALTTQGFLRPGEYIAPGPDAKLDQYGNLSRGLTQQIYARLRIYHDPYQNATRSRRSERTAVAAGRLFWSDGPNSPAKRRRGLWSVDPKGMPKLVLVVVSRTNYKRRIALDAIAAEIIARDGKTIFDAELAKALANAR